MKIKLPPKEARNGWEFKESAIRDACDHLGIKMDVKLRFNSAFLIDGATRSDNKGHRITINQNVSFRRASEVLWHELAHAAQYERVPDFHVRYQEAGGNIYQSKRGYAENIFEHEADKIADSNKEKELTYVRPRYLRLR